MFRTALDSFCLLRKEVGLVQAISIAWELQCHLRRGEPWQSLFPVIDSREQASRDQAGPAILLYTILRSRIGKDRALEITKTIIQIGALHFLKKIVPTFNKKSYQSLSADEQKGKMMGLVEKFPNVTLGTVETSDEQFRFEVTECAFVRLARATGAPELAPLFCAADGAYFQQSLPQVIFERPTTLAENSQPCHFQFRWRESTPERM